METQIKILGYTYDLAVSDSSMYNGNNCGFCDSTKLHIRLANDLGPDMLKSTMLHEIIEAINYHLELKLEHPQITGLEAGLYQVLKENHLERFDEFLDPDRDRASE